MVNGVPEARTYLVAPGYQNVRGGRIALGNIFKDELKIYDLPLSTAPPENELALPKITPFPESVGLQPSSTPAGEGTGAAAAQPAPEQAGGDAATAGPGPADGPAEPIQPVEPAQDATDPPVRRKPALTLVEDKGSNWTASAWARFWGVITAVFSASSRTNVHVAYNIAKIAGEEFAGSDVGEYIEKRVTTDAKLRAHLDSRPAFLITGVKYVTGLEVDLIEASDRAAAAELAARLHQDVEAGGGFNVGRARFSKHVQSVEHEIVFAYQVARITYADKSAGRVSVEVRNRKGGLLSHEGIVRDEEDEEEEEAVVDDILTGDGEGENISSETSPDGRAIACDVLSADSFSGNRVGYLDGEFVQVYADTQQNPWL